MNTNTRSHRFTQLQAEGYLGKRVLTTDNATGYVTGSHPSGDGSRIILYVWTGTYSLVSDHEHATILR